VSVRVEFIANTRPLGLNLQKMDMYYDPSELESMCSLRNAHLDQLWRLSETQLTDLRSLNLLHNGQ
jgi:hypothetical protein